MPVNPLLARWMQWSARFAALQLREKYLIIGAVAVAILFGGFTLWIEPGQLQAARIRQAILQQQEEQAQLGVQVLALGQKTADPNIPRRQALEKLRASLGDAERELKTFESTLVPPTQVPALLQTLMGRHRGLTLISLNTLAPEPIVKSPEKKDDGGKSAKGAPPATNIYKHGIEIRLSGSYHDLLAYVAELENSPQKLMWGDMRLITGKDTPHNELVLTFYTLSLETTWLIV